MMRRLFAFVAIAVVVLLGIAPAMADAGNQEMVFSVTQGPIEIPGRVLDPGKYMLQFADQEHNVLDISTAGGKQIGLFDVVPISRPLPTDQAQLLVAKRNGSVPQLKGFFYPGMETGYELLYPSARVRQIAKASPGASSQGR